MDIKHAKILTSATPDEVNEFVMGKNVDQIVPVIQKNTYNGKEVGDYISQYIIYWFEQMEVRYGLDIIRNYVSYNGENLLLGI